MMFPKNWICFLALAVALCVAGTAQAALTYDFSTGMQGWTQILPTDTVGSPLWASYDNWWFGPDLGHLGDGWEDRDTQLGSSPKFTLDGSGDLTFQFLGAGSPLAAPNWVPSAISATATVNGGFIGVALRDVANDTYVLSKGLSANDFSAWTNMSFTAAQLAPFVIPGREYTLDFIDSDKQPGVGDAWGILGGASIPGVVPEPTAALFAGLGLLALLHRRRNA